jgi:quercetin dioxygenase-like cupin family protein
MEFDMRMEQAGITPASEGTNGVVWQILGQTYVPKSVTDHSFAWHATFPPGTFVPPHSHSTQNEYLYILDGRLDFWLNGAETHATAGDTVRLPMNEPHGIFNKSDTTVKCLFWVAPTGRLYELFQALHDMPEQIPEEVVRIAAEYDVFFLPPPPA